MTYTVGTFREAGLEARWIKHRGTPFISVRNPKARARHQRDTWWIVDRPMFETMEKVGVVEGFDRTTILGDLFYV